VESDVDPEAESELESSPLLISLAGEFLDSVFD